MKGKPACLNTAGFNGQDCGRRKTHKDLTLPTQTIFKTNLSTHEMPLMVNHQWHRVS